MAKSGTFSNDLLKLIFQGTTITGIAQNASSPLTSLFVAMHTADPAGGTQDNHEATYTGYARVGVARTSGGWTVPTAGSVSPVANIVFGTPTGTPADVLTHFSVGVSGATRTATEILYSGALSSAITVMAGTAPTLTSGSAITES